MTAYRHDAKLPVIVHPWGRLVGLLETPDPGSIIGILPAIAHYTGLGRPEIHAPGQRNGRIGVPVGKFMVGLGSHQWVYPVDGTGYHCDQRLVAPGTFLRHNAAGKKTQG